MTRDHDRIEELLAAQALDALDAGDERELRATRHDHGNCDDCARLERELSEVAGLLAFSLTPAAVDGAIVERIVGAGSSVAVLPERSAGSDDAPPERGGEPDALAERRARRDGSRSHVWTAVVGVAAVVVAVAVFATTVVRRPVEVTRADVAGRVVRFEGSADGALAMAYTPGERGAVFWGHGLPDPGDGQAYEIWMIDDGTPIPGGCTTPVDGRIALFVDAEIGTTEQMAITVEPEACPAAPTSEPVLTADLPTL